MIELLLLLYLKIEHFDLHRTMKMKSKSILIVDMSHLARLADTFFHFPFMAGNHLLKGYFFIWKVSIQYISMTMNI